MALGAILQLLVSMAGLTTWNYYLPTIVQSNLGLSRSTGDKVLSACSTWLVVCAVLGIFIIERLGRRGTIMLAFTGLFVCSTILMALMLTGLGEEVTGEVLTSTSAASVAFVFVFEGFWGLLNPAAWLYQAEINSWSSRAVGSAVATTAMYVGTFGSAFYTPYLINNVGTATGAVFLSVNFVGLVYTYLLIPETSGRSLEWLDYYYSRKPPILVIRDAKATKRHWREEMEVMQVDALQPAASWDTTESAEEAKEGFVTTEMMSLHSSRESPKLSDEGIAPISRHDISVVR